MQRQIYWYTLGCDASDAAFVTQAMNQFVLQLNDVMPGLKLAVSELPPQFTSAILPHLQSGHLDGVVKSVHALSDADMTSHLTIYCPDPSHPAVRSARSRLSHAHRGLSIAGKLALTYAPENRHILWHETLHLLGAQDHYDAVTLRTTCTLPSCLMQYAPDEQTVGSRPMICDATAAIIRRACA